MEQPLESADFYKLMLHASKELGFLSGESCKVLIALALRPESRQSLLSLKQVTCIDDNTALSQAISDLNDLNLAKFDGKGGIVINERILSGP